MYFKKYIFLKKNLDIIIILRCILKNIPKSVIKKLIQIVLLVSKLFVNSGYKSLKVKIVYFLFIILIPNSYDMYIMYSQ
jgi:hypothetical protein